MAESETPERRSEARDRLLATASALFYAKGVHAVGVNEIIATAKVTRATFFRHFPSKDDLIVAYLRAADQEIRDAVQLATADPATADDGVRGIARVVAGQIGSRGFRGCAFLNAAAEYPEPDDPIHRAILTHRTWFHDAVQTEFARLTDRAPAAAAHFVLLRDGAMSAGCLGDRRRVTESFLDGVDGMLATMIPVH